MEPYQEHPVPMLLIAVLTCGQTCTALYRQQNNLSNKTNVKIAFTNVKIALDDKIEKN